MRGGLLPSNSISLCNRGLNKRQTKFLQLWLLLLQVKIMMLLTLILVKRDQCAWSRQFWVLMKEGLTSMFRSSGSCVAAEETETILERGSSSSIRVVESDWASWCWRCRSSTWKRFFFYDFVLLFLLSIIVVRVRSRTRTTNRSVGRSTTKKKKGAYGSQRDDFVASTTTTTRTSAWSFEASTVEASSSSLSVVARRERAHTFLLLLLLQSTYFFNELRIT